MRHIKNFFTFLSVIACIFCFFYLLLYPRQKLPPGHIFSSRVLAKEIETISDAHALANHAKKHEKIGAHETRYYYIACQRNLSFTVSSPFIEDLTATVYSEIGNRISCNTQQKNKSYTLKPSIKETYLSQRIFLCITNQSTMSCTVQIQTAVSSPTVNNSPSQTNSNSDNKNQSKVTQKPVSHKNRKANHKPTSNPETKASHKPTPNTKVKISHKPASNTKASHKPASHSNATKQNPISNPNSNNMQNNQSSAVESKTRNSFHNSSQNTYNWDIENENSNAVKKMPENNKPSFSKKIELYPQFLILSPNEKQKLTIKNNIKKKSANQFIWLSTNPDSVIIENGILTTYKEGTAIIYLQDKKQRKNTSSCLVRVIS